MRGKYTAFYYKKRIFIFFVDYLHKKALRGKAQG